MIDGQVDNALGQKNFIWTNDLGQPKIMLQSLGMQQYINIL